jgi:hypothetical protein
MTDIVLMNSILELNMMTLVKILLLTLMKWRTTNDKGLKIKAL